MSMNQYMHPRNIYKKPPDFKQLALNFPEFKNHIKLDIAGKAIFDFKDLNALRALSTTLLKKDFGLDVEIPKNKLIPTIPLRLNYILWIEDLLDFIGRTNNVKGIDIGTGASCVYPLLAARKNEWVMMATETDPVSIECARRNIEKNKLQDLINVVEVKSNNLLTDVIKPDEKYDFCMCNPPFFSSTQELHPFFKSRKVNRPHPKNAFVASVNEVVAKGGEVDFIQRIITESKALGTQIIVYTSMVGQKSHLPALKKSLREAEVHSFRETEFCQGNTTRWGLAWTYSDNDIRKMPDLVKLAAKPSKKHAPLLHELSEQEPIPENVSRISDLILRMFQGLKMTFEEVTRSKTHLRYFVTAYSNTWAHQRRKRREQVRKCSETQSENNNSSFSDQEGNSPGKRNLDIICESTSKKLRLSTDSENSESPATVFYKFMFALKCDAKIVIELNTLDDFSDRDNLHQILQYIKNNLNRKDKQLS